MTNIEIRGKMLNEKTGNFEDATYTVDTNNLDSIDRRIKDYYCHNRSYYINLDAVASFLFEKTQEDIKLNCENAKYASMYDYEVHEILIPKGTNLICLKRFLGLEPLDGSDFYNKILVFPKESEFQKFKRILTEKLCVK